MRGALGVKDAKAVNIVIGGGPAGMMAAGIMAGRGRDTLLLERNNKLGKKLYITGKGRCNLTNTADVPDTLENVPGNPYFLYSALYAFDSAACINFFESLGVPTKIERGGRVFPASEKASDIVRALERFLARNNVKVRLNTGVREILPSAVKTDYGEIIGCENIIVATGGLSYPVTGSTGDGYSFARSAGHTVTKLYPSIVPLRARESWVAELQGLSLKNIAIEVKNDRARSLYKDFGELMFTHYGVSGPVILSASRHIIAEENITLGIDLKPALDEKELDDRLLRDFKKYINKSFKNSLDDLLPQKLIPIIIRLSGIDPEAKVHDIKKENRRRLGFLLKNLTLTILGAAGYNEAVITSGGVCVDELDPATMQSKLRRGLYFAGEVIDVDAYTGGFNLQIAFATGSAAGNAV